MTGSRQPARSPIVLLVEDFEDARTMYRDYLTFAGFEVLAFETAADGIREARERRPDLILMDAGLPGMTGWDAVRALKGDPATRSVPVVMLTGHVLKESRDEAVLAGADGFIAKPCLPDDLVREIHAVLAAHPPRAGASSAQRQRRSRRAAATAKRLERGRQRR